MLALNVGLLGSLWLRMPCEPWQLWQLAATSRPSLFSANPWMESTYFGYTLGKPCFCAMPSFPWHLPQVPGTFRGYTVDRASLFGKMECGSLWQLVHGCS